MKERFIENGIEYVRNGDYYIPNLTVPDDKVYNIGKYGRMHAKFIKENRPCFYSMKMMNGTWLAYLEEIDTSAKEMVNKITKDMAMKLYIVGGGGCLIRNFADYDKSRVTINGDIHATAKGYEYLAELGLKRGVKNG